MDRIDASYRYPATPRCHDAAVVQGDKYRFTILTPSLIRMEYSERGVFEDRATQVVINRQFEVPPFTVRHTGDMLKIYTDRVELTYHTQHPFGESSLTARFYGEWGDHTMTWRYKNTWPTYGNAPRTLFGTLRSLDVMKGPVPLEKGLMSGNFTEWDDSRSLILAEDGWVDERADDAVDTYLFAYRNHYVECLHDFLQLSGKLPLLPRYALGNWWSRYYPYSAEEYQALIEKFAEKQVPLSVAVLDMDWHITDIDKKYGTGWSGYTWNRELFPDHRAFLRWLHEKGLAVTANLHDREGIAPHEENYLPMAKALGIDWENGQKINFDFGNPRFVEAYFRYTHHGNEQDGIDFWWVDGFPENTSALAKADIPWMLNHYHCVDQLGRRKRAMLLSRNSGMGGHRYGVGFSGDTCATWEMLDFLPYFTATASNVGFGWWSHDVGGFMAGEHDDERMVRWTQMGVFSPITRLHSCDNPFMSKEPWNYGEVAERVISRYLRLRHELIPYLYTMNYQCFRDNITLIRPLYYYGGSHGMRNEYYFGDELLVRPITTRMDAVTRMGSCEVYLPDGLWFDFFNSRAYKGDRRYKVYRDIDGTPVFAKAGGIIPQAVLNGENGTANPQALKVDIFPGADNRFTLYEDDGVTLGYQNGESVVTRMTWKWGTNPVFTIDRPEGELSLIPARRDYTLVFRKLAGGDRVEVTVDEKAAAFTQRREGDALILQIGQVSGALTVRFADEVTVAKNDYVAEMDALLWRMQISYAQKWEISKILHRTETPAQALAELARGGYPADFRAAATEILLADRE